MLRTVSAFDNISVTEASRHSLSPARLDMFSIRSKSSHKMPHIYKGGDLRACLAMKQFNEVSDGSCKTCRHHAVVVVAGCSPCVRSMIAYEVKLSRAAPWLIPFRRLRLVMSFSLVGKPFPIVAHS